MFIFDLDTLFLANNYPYINPPIFRIMQKRWVVQKEGDQASIARLIEEVNVNRPLANILAQRGINTYEEAKKFFRPDLKNLHDPFLMKGMEDAVNRVEQAIASNENILIYGDYDVDGTTAVALMYSYLTRTYEQVGYYIPDRYQEGYGISDQGIDFAIDNSFTLIIALDCGIKAVDKIARAKSEGVDFIVCDHHTPGEEIPDAIILNPKQKDCQYPFKELCGCGVGFKLVQAIHSSRDGHFSDIQGLLDLVMVAIGADIVSVMGENRILAHYGINRLNANPRIGFKEILKLSKQKIPLTVTDVVFVIAPRINAAGRITSGEKAVKMLLAESQEEVEEVAFQINEHNEERKGLDKDITAEALQMIAEDEWLRNAQSTVLYKDDWHKGVVGIVASRLTETYYRPTIVLTESNGKAVGSARSVNGFNIYEAIGECADLLEQFGGHDFAAGMTLDIEKVGDFRLKFDEVVRRNISKDLLIPEISIDTMLDFRDIFGAQRGGIPRFYHVLKQLAPFGPDNMKPVFMTKNVRDKGYSRILKDEHLKLQVFQEEDEDLVLDGIGFGLAKYASIVKSGLPFDITYTVEINDWNGKQSLQLMVKDIRKSEFPT